MNSNFFPGPLMENHSKVLKIMVVDDNHTSQSVMSKLLKQASYEVTLCESAGDALYTLQERNKERFDLVLIEPHVGHTGFSSRLTGSKLLEHIQREIKIPVFTMCVHDDNGTLMESLNKGTFFHFTKPLTADKMDMMRQQVLQKRAKETLAQFSGNLGGYRLNGMIGSITNPLGAKKTLAQFSGNLGGYGLNRMIGTSSNMLGAKETLAQFSGNLGGYGLNGMIGTSSNPFGAKETLAQFSGNLGGCRLNGMIGTSSNPLGPKKTLAQFSGNFGGYGLNGMIGTSSNPMGNNSNNFIGTHRVFSPPQYERDQSDAGSESDEDDKGKKRMRWDDELHNKFLMALETLKEDRISPVNILRVMDVEGITTKHVASHLQKYRRYLKEGEGSSEPKRCRRVITPNQFSLESPSFIQASGSGSSYPSNINIPNFPKVNVNNSLSFRGLTNPLLKNYNLVSPITGLNTPKHALVYKPVNPLFKPFQTSYPGFWPINNSFKQNFTASNSKGPQVNLNPNFVNLGLMNNPNNMLNMPKLADNNGNKLWGLNWKRVDEEEKPVYKEESRVDKEERPVENKVVLADDDQTSINITPNGLSLVESSGSSKEKSPNPNDDNEVPGKSDFAAFILNEIGGVNNGDNVPNPSHSQMNDIYGVNNYCFDFDEDKIDGFETIEELIGDKNPLEIITMLDEELENEELENNGEGIGSSPEDEEVKKNGDPTEKEKKTGDDETDKIDMEKFESDENFMETMLS